jgi:predicted GNAT family acetyltransferase
LDPAQTLALARAAEARELTSIDGDAVLGLRAACSHEDWRHGGSEHGEVPTFGSFNAQDELCAVAGYKTWNETIAHLAIVCAPGRRGRGFASAAVSCATQHALRANLIPQYRTLLSNEPSMSIATRLGFEMYGFSVYVRLGNA